MMVESAAPDARGMPGTAGRPIEKEEA